MNEVTRLLAGIQDGQPAAAELLPLVYAELRRVAAAKMAREQPGQTLQPTALVHEAWIRLVDADGQARFENRAHFFSAAVPDPHCKTPPPDSPACARAASEATLPL